MAAINIRKIENVIKLNNIDRYNYFIREVVKLEKVWAISTSDSWLTFIDNNNDTIFPVWPHKEVAELCLFEEFKQLDFIIESIDYTNFKEYCIPDMLENNIYFGVFYNNERKALIVSGEDLLNDLEIEENE